MHYILWGHGDWGPEDGHTNVPPGSELYFFARHKEEINTQRMDGIFYAVTTGLEREVPDIIANEHFNLRDSGDLRRIRPEHARVRNYMLRRPSGGVKWPWELDPGLQAVCRVVTAAHADGESLESLFARCTDRPAKFLWLPCRAVRGDEGKVVDSVNYFREGGYFRAG